MASDARLTIDARGMRCPWPALRAARAMREGDSFAIVADDPQAARELAALAESRGWRIEAKEPEPIYFLDRKSDVAAIL